MSQANLELARSAIQAWNAGDLDGLRDLYAPDAILSYPSGWVEGGPYVGRDAIMDQFGAIREIYPESSFEDVDLRDAGDHVVAHVDYQSEVRGLQLTTDMAWVYTCRDGLIVSCEFFRSEREALEAAGLSA